MQEFSLEKFSIGNEQKINRKWVYGIAIPIIEKYKIENKIIADLRNKVLQFLKVRTVEEPQYPNDYKRFFPQIDNMDKYEVILKAFCEDPILSKYDFKRNEMERKGMENTIRTHNLDISTQTIKQKSPYTLQLTKNTKSYTHILNEYKEDLMTIEKLKKFA